MGKAIQSTFAFSVPAVHPVADNQTSVRSKRDIGGQNGPEKFVRISKLKRCPFRADGKTSDAAVSCGTSKIGHKEMVGVTLRQTHARIMR